MYLYLFLHIYLQNSMLNDNMPDNKAGPDGSFVLTEACNLGVSDSNYDRAGYLSSLLCIYSAPNCLKVWSVQCCLCLWHCAL